MTAAAAQARIGVVMGSRSDWETMQHAVAVLDQLGITHEVRVVSAHRTPDAMFEYAASGAGGAAHLPGMLAAKTRIPVLGVPVQSHAMQGLDSLYSIVQMPAGIPVATFAIGRAGAINAALYAAAMLALSDSALDAYRKNQTASVLAHLDPREG